LVALIAAKRRVEAAGGRLTVINPSPRVRRVLNLSGTADVFDVAVADG
jgi:anti-anti-sigma regulatory factor